MGPVRGGDARGGQGSGQDGGVLGGRLARCVRRADVLRVGLGGGVNRTISTLSFANGSSSGGPGMMSSSLLSQCESEYVDDVGVSGNDDTFGEHWDELLDGEDGNATLYTTRDSSSWREANGKKGMPSPEPARAIDTLGMIEGTVDWRCAPC